MTVPEQARLNWTELSISHSRTALTAAIESREDDLTPRELWRWQELRYQASRAADKVQALELVRRHEEAILARFEADRIADQQPRLLVEPRASGSVVHQRKGELQRLLSMRTGAIPITTASAGLRWDTGSISLGELQGLDGRTFLSQPGEKGEKRRWDVESIKRDTDVRSLVEKYGVSVRSGKTRCFVHNSQGEEAMTVNQGYAHCFSCGWAGDAIKIVQHFEGCDFSAACEILGGVRVGSGVTYTPPEGLKRREEEQAVCQIDFDPLVTAAHDALVGQQSETARAALAYLESRGFDMQDVESFALGVVDESVPTRLLPLTSKGKHHLGWRGRIVIPDLDVDDNVRYVKARLFLPQSPGAPGEQPPKRYLNPYGVHTQPFRMGMLKPTGDVLLVEGELDALTVATALTASVIAVPGVHNLRREHAEELARRGGRVYLMLDPDVDLTGAGGPGQHVDARKVVKRLQDAGCDLYLVPPLSSDPADDLNALLQRVGREELALWLGFARAEAQPFPAAPVASDPAQVPEQQPTEPPQLEISQLLDLLGARPKVL